MTHTVAFFPSVKEVRELGLFLRLPRGKLPNVNVPMEKVRGLHCPPLKMGTFARIIRFDRNLVQSTPIAHNLCSNSAATC